MNGISRAKDSDCLIQEKDLTIVDINTSNTDRDNDTKMKNGKASQCSKAGWLYKYEN